MNCNEVCFLILAHFCMEFYNFFEKLLTLKKYKNDYRNGVMSEI